MNSAFDLVRPLVWLAAAAFLVGFGGCLALGAVGGAHAYVRAHAGQGPGPG